LVLFSALIDAGDVDFFGEMVVEADEVPLRVLAREMQEVKLVVAASLEILLGSQVGFAFELIKAVSSR
jgi:hypothetical protein